MTKKTDTKNQQPVVLQKDHTHRGEECRAGSTIYVTVAEKNWLLAQRVIAPEAEPKTTPAE